MRARAETVECGMTHFTPPSKSSPPKANLRADTCQAAQESRGMTDPLDSTLRSGRGVAFQPSHHAAALSRPCI
jgi:hypothetical protein